MAAPVLNNNTEFVQVNTQANAGTLTLPNASELPGRILTFKDIVGSFPQNPFTLTTSAGNTFDDGTRSKILRERFGFIKVASDGVSRWNVLEGTQMPMFTISSLNAVAGLSTVMMSTAQMTVSTLQLNDTLLTNVQSNLYTSSSLLYCGTQIVGGTKVASGPTLLTRVPGPFVPTQIPYVSLWLDGNDINTIQTPTTVVNWLDKSGNNRNARKPTSINGPGDPTLTNRGVNFNRGFALLKVANMPSAPYDIFVVGSPDPVNTSWRTFVRTQNIPGTHPLLVETGSTRVGMWSGTFAQFGSYTWLPSEQAMFYVSISSSRTETASKNGDINLTAATQAGNESQITCVGNNVEPNAAQQAGIINELIIYNTTLAQDQRQLVEGYLAWKWGLVGKLPILHPFKFVPPGSFSLLNTPYFLSFSGDASLVFTWSYLLTSGLTNSSTNIFIYTNAATPVAVANTTPALGASVFSFTSDGTTNGTTGKLTANLTLGTFYLARVQINIPSAVFSTYTQAFRYGTAALAATSPAFTATGANLSLSWVRNSSTTQPSNNTLIYFYTDVGGTGAFVSSTDRTTANTFTTDGTSATGNLGTNLTFGLTYYFRVATSNVINTSYTLSAVSAGGLFGTAALAPTFTSATGGATITVNWTRNSSYSQPSNATKVFFYTDAGGTVLSRESVNIGTVATLTTDGTTATGQMLTDLSFNTTYYVRVGTSNTLSASYQNSSGVSAAVKFGDAPIVGTITSYTGGATMTAALGSTATLAQPITSSNVYFYDLSNTIIATKTGYTGGNSYSTTGVAGDFTSGSLVFYQSYYMRLRLINGLTGGTNFRDTVLVGPQRYGAAPTAAPTSPVYGGFYVYNANYIYGPTNIYYGRPAIINWTPPSGATQARPVTSVTIERKSGSLVVATYTATNSANTLTMNDINNSMNSQGFGYTLTLYSTNALGTSTSVSTSIPFWQFIYSLSYPVISNSGASTTYNWLNGMIELENHTALNVDGIVSYDFFGNNYSIITIYFYSLTGSKTLTWSYSTNYTYLGQGPREFSIGGQNYTNGTEFNSGTTTIQNGSSIFIYMKAARTINDCYYGFTFRVA